MKTKETRSNEAASSWHRAVADLETDQERAALARKMLEWEVPFLISVECNEVIPCFTGACTPTVEEAFKLLKADGHTVEPGNFQEAVWWIITMSDPDHNREQAEVVEEFLELEKVLTTNPETMPLHQGFDDIKDFADKMRGMAEDLKRRTDLIETQMNEAA